MSKRGFNILLGISALVFGSLIYILFRENTYIAKCFESFDIVIRMRQILLPYKSCFLIFYFGDFLWALSLGCGLYAIFVPRIYGTVICTCVVLCLGCVWEVLQYCSIISGTGDILDMLAYLLASSIIIIINAKERET